MNVDVDVYTVQRICEHYPSVCGHFGTGLISFLFYWSPKEMLEKSPKVFPRSNKKKEHSTQNQKLFFLLLEAPCLLVTHLTRFRRWPMRAWVTRPERREGAKDEVKRPEEPPTGSQARKNEIPKWYQGWSGFFRNQKYTWRSTFFWRATLSYLISWEGYVW